MVHDHIRYASEYFNLSDGIRLALEYLRRTDLAALAAGRHDVDGDAVFALVSDYETRRHVDVQFVQRGRERVAYGDLADFESEPYDARRDLTIARGTCDRFVTVGPGGFVILFPHDVHMPGLSTGTPEAVRKIVVKVRIRVRE